MSVVVFSRSEMAELTRAVIYSEECMDCLTWEKGSFAAELQSLNFEQKKERVAAWMDRLWIGNQIAAAYAYERDLSVMRLWDMDINNGDPFPFDGKQLYRKLSDLNYNLYTNEGYSFVSDDEHRRLNRLIACVASYILTEDL